MNWLDSHCHINDEAFREDLNEVLDRMVENDVLKAMIISCGIEEYRYGLNISHPEISFLHSLGVFPGDVDETDEKLFEENVALFNTEECAAIGEIGLDYYWDKDNWDRQKEIFEAQVKIAEELKKPIIVHSRDAIEDTYEILKAHHVKGVMHCYSDSAEMAKKFLDLGLYISIAGPVTWKKNEKALEVIHTVPIERMLIETDCPYLTPAPNRGKRNEPSYVVYTGRKIAEELGLEEETFKIQLNNNYEDLFGL